MKMLLDTNVLLRLSDRGHAMHAETLAVIDWLDAHGVECLIVPQVLYEYWECFTNTGPSSRALSKITGWE